MGGPSPSHAPRLGGNILCPHISALLSCGELGVMGSLVPNFPVKRTSSERATRGGEPAQGCCSCLPAGLVPQQGALREGRRGSWATRQTHGLHPQPHTECTPTQSVCHPHTPRGSLIQYFACFASGRTTARRIHCLNALQRSVPAEAEVQSCVVRVRL